MLPGFDAQVKMSPPFRKKYTLKDAYDIEAKESSVLILLYEKSDDVYIVLTERKIYKGAHSGQISLPGGKKDDIDYNFEATAIRETFEEIGIESSKIEIICQLSHLYIPVSNNIVFPFVGVLNELPKFVKQETEVENIIEIKLEDLLKKENNIKKLIKIESKNIQFRTPAFALNNVEIWGATAMILNEFLEIITSKTKKL